MFGRKTADEETVVEDAAEELEYVPSEPLKRVLRDRYQPGIAELNRQKDMAEQAIGCFTKATEAIQSIRPLIKESKAIAITARQIRSAEKKEFLADRYSGIRAKIDKAAKSAIYKDVNLVDGSGARLSLGASSHYSANLNISSINLTTERKGLALPPVRFQFSEAVEIEDIVTCAAQAETYLDWAEDLLCQEAQMVASRLSEVVKLVKLNS